MLKFLSLKTFLTSETHRIVVFINWIICCSNQLRTKCGLLETCYLVLMLQSQVINSILFTWSSLLCEAFSVKMPLSVPIVVITINPFFFLKTVSMKQMTILTNTMFEHDQMRSNVQTDKCNLTPLGQSLENMQILTANWLRFIPERVNMVTYNWPPCLIKHGSDLAK